MGTKRFVTAHTQPSRPLALAAAVAVAFAALAPLPVLAAPESPGPNAACDQALRYEKVAATDTISRQASYDSAVAGLSANQRCSDPQMKLVNEAYLLSMRAAAEHELKVGNWQRDLERANMLLTQCANWPGLRGTKAASDCTTQRQYNQITAKTLTTVPSPRPAASPSGMPAPASPAPGASPARTAMPLPRPVAPSSQPSPRP